MTQINLKNLCKSYGALDVLKNVDLSINCGEFVAFVGPSGSGKSTLLRLICGLEDITEGSIEFDGKNVAALSPSERGVAMVFQSYALYPHMTVYENMAFALRQIGRSRTEIRRRVVEAAETLEIGHLLDRKPRQLSGGQRQRVAIGRAIVRDPKVFLFDEPLSNLDAALRAQTRLEIASLNARMRETSMIYVTHDQVEAMTLADRICLLHDGRIMQVGSPRTIYDTPESVFVASFIGSPSINLMRGRWAEMHGCRTLGVRPEHIYRDEDQPAWKGKVKYIEDLGAEQYIHVEIDDRTNLVVRREEESAIRIGQAVGLSADPGKLHRFDAQDQRLE